MAELLLEAAKAVIARSEAEYKDALPTLGYFIHRLRIAVDAAELIEKNKTVGLDAWVLNYYGYPEAKTLHKNRVGLPLNKSSGSG